MKLSHGLTALVVDCTCSYSLSAALQTFEDGISKLLTACPAMSIIIASRTSDMFVGSSISVSSLHMKPLAVADAQSLVEHFAQHTPHAVAAQLAEMCENTPIALSVVSKAIGDSPSLGKVGSATQPGKWLVVHFWHVYLVCACCYSCVAVVCSIV